jgi:transcriptional regulator with XRE-family HTH domain
MQEDFNHIKQWILPILESKNISIENLAQATGITRSAIYAYLSDKNRPTTETMRRICSVLNVAAEEGLKQYTERKVGRPAGTIVS